MRRPCESVVTLVERFRDLRDLGAAPDFVCVCDRLRRAFTEYTVISAAVVHRRRPGQRIHQVAGFGRVAGGGVGGRRNQHRPLGVGG